MQEVRQVWLQGGQPRLALQLAGITTNKNAIPFDEAPPKITSGLRVGTPALTTRGLREPDMIRIAGFIASVLRDPADEKTLNEVRQGVRELCEAYPLYQELPEI